MKLYISQGALFAINISAQQTEDIETLLNSTGDANIPKEIFRNAKEEILNLLYKDSYFRFIQTRAFSEARDKDGRAVQLA